MILRKIYEWQIPKIPTLSKHKTRAISANGLQMAVFFFKPYDFFN